MNWKTKLPSIFGLDRIFRRAIAAWFFSAMTLLATRSGDYTSTEYLKDAGLGAPILVFSLFFLVISALAFVLPTKRTDGFAMLMGLVSVSVVWLARMEMTVEEKWLFCFTLVGVFALVLWDFVRANDDILTRLHLPRAVSPWAAVILAVFCGAVIAITTCLRYATFATPTYDFGIFVQMYHNMAETLAPITTCERNEVLSHFAVHLSPIYYVLLPFYMIFPSPMTLQIGQAVVIASGMIPFYFLMRRFGLSAKARVVFSAIYALYPVISKGCFFDLHENCFLFTILLWLFWAYESERLPLVALFTVLCCLVKEDSAVYVAIFSLYVLISGESKKKKWTGFAMLVYAVLYFLFACWYIDTFGKGIMSGRYENVSSDGSLFGVIVTAFANPGFFIQQLTVRGWESVKYFLALLVPLAFLPLATGKGARRLLLVPMLLNLLTSYPYQLELIYQYHFGIAAFLLYLSVMNFRDLSGKVKRYLPILALAAGFVFYSYLVLPEMGTRIQSWNADAERYESLADTLEAIPDDASVNASTFLVTHLAEREVVYEIGYHKTADTDFVVLDIRWGYDETSKAMLSDCLAHNYRMLIETHQVAILVSPDWQGDTASVREAVEAVVGAKYERESGEEAFAMMKAALSVLPTDATVNASTSLVPYVPPCAAVYEVASHPMADTHFVVLDIRGGYGEESGHMAVECMNYGFGCLLENEQIAIYVSPLWEGDVTALKDALAALGVPNAMV
ncbi:MAG: DUF2079 domain-containing protein [Clostridia bacterium]|nr:DUF2079 domain-containing protein [Clostridia bacterium]